MQRIFHTIYTKGNLGEKNEIKKTILAAMTKIP